MIASSPVCRPEYVLKLWTKALAHALLCKVRLQRADVDDQTVASTNWPLLDERASLTRVQGGDEVLHTHLPSSAPEVRKRSYQIGTAQIISPTGCARTRSDRRNHEDEYGLLRKDARPGA